MEYRFYGFGNYYLSSLQQGLQSAHSIADMFVKYRKEQEQQEIIYDWAQNHKTMVLLNGGNSLSLSEIHKFFEELNHWGMNLPFASFNEDEQSLGGALTYVGIVVPSEVYELASAMRAESKKDREERVVQDNDWKTRLALKLNEFGLAH